MASCPRCKAQYPEHLTACPRDGTALIREAFVTEPTESMALSRAPSVPPPLGPPPIPPSADDIAAPIADLSGSWPQGTDQRSEGGARAETRAERPGRRRSGNASGERRRRPATERPEERVGRVLGSYRLLELIGRGGMGCVYRAEHIKLGRQVALKLLRDDYARRRDAVSRFFQEARSVNRIRHRNIVDVTDFVELGDGTTFIIMELLDGASLGSLARSQQLTAPRVLALLIQICDGLAAAHGVGIVHRDLKPDNVIVVPTGDGADVAKLLDFGVAKLLYREEEQDYGWETAAGSVIGTPAYMSPEQAGGLTVDARSDIYSLGAIMYEIFCGQPMFKARSFGEYVRKHLNDKPARPRDTPGGAGIDERIEAVIWRCIEKRPDDRYPGVEALRADLLSILGAVDTNLGESVAGRAAALAFHGAPTRAPLGRVPPGLPPHSEPTADLDSAQILAHETSMSFGDVPRTAVRGGAPSWLPWSAALAALALVGGGVALYLTSRPPESAARARPANAAGQDPSRQEAPAPQVQSVPRATVDTSRAVGQVAVVRFEAAPRAQVLVAGTDAPLCNTPCDVTIDPRDGGDPEMRRFVVTRAGYREVPVTIDLGDPRDTVSVRLERRGSRNVAAPTAAPDLDAELRSNDSAAGGDATPRKTERVTAPPTGEPAKPDERAPDRSGRSGQGSSKIDPADTLNPFGD